MANKLIEYVTPRKGKVNFDSYAEAAIDAALDALNVLPFDDVGLARMGQRSGTTKLWADTLNGHPVTMLDQTTLALDPASVTANQELLNEPFTYADGNLHDVGGAGTTWRTSVAGQVHGIFTATTANAMLVASNAVRDNNGNRVACVYQPALSLGTAYVLKLTCRLTSTMDTADEGWRVLARINKSNYADTTNIVTFTVRKNGAVLYQGTSAQSTYAPGTDVFSTSSDVTIELRVNGNVFQGWVNGVKYVQATLTGGASNTGIGFGSFDSGADTGTADNFIVYTGTNLASYRQTDLVAVAGDDLYVGDISTQAEIAVGGTGVVFDGTRPEGAFSAGKMYLVDGFSIIKLDVATRTVETYTATAGSAPQYCTLACMWRDRLVLAAPRDNPHNFFASRVGTHTDWDYSQTDSAAAFAGNASTAGRIGNPITALIPASDDVLVIGGDHDIWVVRGDPADGGSIDLLSDSIGVLGARAWTKSQDGTVYFVGTGGFYKMPASGGTPVLLSDQKLNAFFRDINRGTHYITLSWHRDRQGCFIFVTPVNTGSATHLWYDARTESFWPVQFPNSHGPLSALVYDGDAPDDRELLLGGRTGYVQKYDETAKGSDDGTAISSYVIWGPTKFSDAIEAVVEWADVILAKPASGLADADINATFSVLTGPTVERAYNSPRYTRSRTFTRPRRQSRLLLRSRGNAFLLKLANSTLNKTWGFEKAIVMYLPGGLVRNPES